MITLAALLMEMNHLDNCKLAPHFWNFVLIFANGASQLSQINVVLPRAHARQAVISDGLKLSVAWKPLTGVFGMHCCMILTCSELLSYLGDNLVKVDTWKDWGNTDCVSFCLVYHKIKHCWLVRTSCVSNSGIKLYLPMHNVRVGEI